MKVKELIEILEGMNPEAEVYTMSQKQWPFENVVKAVVERDLFEEVDREEEDAKAQEDPYYRRKTVDDVFIVEGKQIRYGNKEAWDY